MCDHAAREKATLLVDAALNKLRALEPDEVGVAHRIEQAALLAAIGATDDLIHVIAVIAASRRLGDPEIQELTRIGIEIR